MPIASSLEEAREQAGDRGAVSPAKRDGGLAGQIREEAPSVLVNMHAPQAWLVTRPQQTNPQSRSNRVRWRSLGASELSGEFKPGVEATGSVGVVAEAGGKGLDEDDAVAVVAGFGALVAGRDGHGARIDDLAAQGVPAVIQREGERTAMTGVGVPDAVGAGLGDQQLCRGGAVAAVQYRGGEPAGLTDALGAGREGYATENDPRRHELIAFAMAGTARGSVTSAQSRDHTQAHVPA